MGFAALCGGFAQDFPLATRDRPLLYSRSAAEGADRVLRLS